MKLLDINSPGAIKKLEIPKEDLEKYIPAERKAKSYAIGRKNFLFHTSVDGAVAGSIIYSLVETAKTNNRNVFQYLYILLLYMPGCKSGFAGMEQLMPWSDFIKEHCSGLIDIDTITLEEHPVLSG